MELLARTMELRYDFQVHYHGKENIFYEWNASKHSLASFIGGCGGSDILQ